MDYYLDSKQGNIAYANDYYAYIRSMFYRRVADYAISVDNALWFGEDISIRYTIHKFIADCCTKVFIKRLGLPYNLTGESNLTFDNTIMKNGVLDKELLS